LIWNEGAGIGGVARPHLRTDWPIVAVDQDRKDHLPENRTVIP
jgi:hypothetical protein